jgi:ORF6N domain
VVLDSDLAALYCVTTKVFNQAIQRNTRRFPADFLFRLTQEEYARLKSQLVTALHLEGRVSRSQIVTLKADRRGHHRKYLPWAFTEHGAIMAAMLLRSERAVTMSVYVVRAFVRMREELASGAVILRRLAEIDKKLLIHDFVLRDIYAKLRPLLHPPPQPRRKEIGFHAGLKTP